MEHSLKIVRTLNAPRDKVFQAFTRKEELEKWFCPESMTVAINEIDLSVGGALKLTMTSKEGNDYVAAGVFKEVAEPEKIVFTWQWLSPEPGAETLITVMLVAQDGKTELTFLHEKFAEEKQKQMHEEGWTSAFNKLEKLFA